jgi:hypothetical protein
MNWKGRGRNRSRLFVVHYPELILERLKKALVSRPGFESSAYRIQVYIVTARLTCSV